MRAITCLLLAAALLSVGCIGILDDGGEPTDDPTRTGDDAPATEAASPAASGSADDRTQPRVTVAVVDSGANLYHEAFGTTTTWQAHVPLQASPVELSLEASDWSTAVEEDWSALMGLERGELYTFPGTRFVAAISFETTTWCYTSANAVCQEGEHDWPLLLDDPGRGAGNYSHGALTTGRAVGAGMSLAGDEDRIGLVLVQTGFGASEIEGIRWASQQPWIDAISLSLKESPESDDRAAFLEAVDEAAHRKPVFKAAGNGLPDRLTRGYVAKPAWAYDGTPDEISVGGVDNEGITTWTDLHPYIAADACGVDVPVTDSMDEIQSSGGTSMSAPYVAGAAAKVILQARDLLGDTHLGPRTDESLSPPDGAWSSQRAEDAQVVLARGQAGTVDEGPLADGVFTLRELKDVLYHTARPLPAEGPHDGPRCEFSPIPAEDLPDRQRFAHIGYGEIDPTSLDGAMAALAGDGELLDRPTADEEYIRAHSLRSETMGPRTTTGP